MKKITVLVSGGGTNLGALISACQNKKIQNGNISLVISSNPDAYAIERAKTANIRTLVVDRKKYNDVQNFNYYIKLRGGKDSPTKEFYEVPIGISFKEFNKYINHV